MAAEPLAHEAAFAAMDRASIVDHQDAWIGEGLVDGGAVERSSSDTSPRHRRKLLDYLDVDDGERFLDDTYDDNDNLGYDSEPRSPGRKNKPPSLPLHPVKSSIPRPAVINPSEIDSDQLGRIVAEEAERKQRARQEKEQAWLKFRQLLVEEEQKIAFRKEHIADTSSKSVDESSTRCSFGTVRLLDHLARPGEDFYNRSVSSDVDAAPIVDSSLAQAASSDNTSASLHEAQEPPMTFAEHMDRMGNRIAQFLNRGQPSEAGEDHDMAKSKRFLQQFSNKPANDFVPGKSSARFALLATLEQVTRMCQRAELSENSMTRISTLLSSINQIVYEDMDRKNGAPKRSLRRLSRTNWSKSEQESSEPDKDSREPTAPVEEGPSEFLTSYSSAPENAVLNVAPTVLESFKAFDAAQDLGDTLVKFNKLMTDCGLDDAKVDEPWRIYSYIKAALYSKLSFRHKQLFKLLDARFNIDVYKRKSAWRKRVCIVGAGPVGLRAAVEAALLGGQVVVLEKRQFFSRENMLHLWPWVVQDLTSLGAKVLYPRFCKSNTYFHISTRQLQVILLKVALLVGVTVYSSTSFASLVPPSSEDKEKSFYTVATQPQISTMEFTAVLGASGTNDNLAGPAGINRFVFCRKESLGIVCYFPNLGTTEEAKVKEFSWTSEFRNSMLEKLREVGIDLENIVYYRGEMHYLVMTPKRQSLLDRQVVNKNHESSADLVLDENINKSALHEYVKSIVDFAGIPRKTDFTRVSLFDFSSRSRADRAASILTSHGKKLYLGLIGDSLLEPVWHEDVGISRGFLGALDAVWMVAQIGLKSDEELLADRENAYCLMQRITNLHRDELQKNVRKYTVEPKSRYTVRFP